MTNTSETDNDQYDWKQKYAEKDLIHALEAYRNATISENIRHWFKTIGH